MAEPGTVEEGPGLPELIDMQIRQGGPISVATYMGLCLSHPSRGYYRRADPFGTAGDFVTAPEISQMFGEIVGAWSADLWQRLGASSFTLLELGPGRGTLMADALRVMTRLPGLAEKLTLALFESSPVLIEAQRTRLGQYDPVWINDTKGLEALPAQPVIVIANEFFDALPIRQFVRRAGAWHERMVGLGETGRAFGLSPTPLPDSAFPEAVRAAREGAVYEAGIAATGFMKELAQAVAGRGGAILAFDYGYGATRTGETLQAVRAHAYADPLAEPGAADLSAHVDFGALGEAAAAGGLHVHPLRDQGEFLLGLGLGERAARLGTPEAETALRRLVDPDQMGTLFKVFCAASPELRPAGFAP